MAERPIFIPTTRNNRLVDEVSISFVWNPGMAPSQKKKNIVALHEAAALRGFAPLLEISSKSEELLGQRLSAFSLKIALRDFETTIESAYQGSKVFARGGPYTDLYAADSRAAKTDSRLRESGQLVGFRFENEEFPLFPKTAFYDWLFVKALYPHREFLKRIHLYAGFTDIEFNPERSLNCQARSCAMFVSLDKKNLLDSCIQSFESFSAILEPDSIEQPHSYSIRQRSLL
jgi:hypothetical protein